MPEKINKWYILGLWSAGQVRKALEKGILTAAEAARILGA